MSDFPGGQFHIRRRLDGAVRMQFGREVIVVSPENAVRLGQALLKEAGVEMVLAEPGQTVIRPPQRQSFPHGGKGRRQSFPHGGG